MRITNTRLIAALLTFFLGVLLVYLADGFVRPLIGGAPVDADRCYH